MDALLFHPHQFSQIPIFFKDFFIEAKKVNNKIN